MLFCQLAHADSLREICNGLGCCLGKLVHLGIATAPNKSTLSYANEHRPAQLYEDLFYTALARFRDEEGMGQRKKKFRFKNKLLSLDSTTISLCLKLFPWAVQAALDHRPRPKLKPQYKELITLRMLNPETVIWPQAREE